MILAIRKRLEQREEGFTLIELLVVVIIIGILAAIAVPTFLNQRAKAGDSAAKADLRNAAIAQESYYTDNATYATDAILKTPASATNPATGAGFKASGNVTLTVVSANASGTNYCMSAQHTNGVIWYLRNTDGAPVTAPAC